MSVPEVMRKLDEIISLLKARSVVVADDRDLDSEWGNPTVRFDPRSWKGPSYKGKRFSECPPDFLRELAKAMESFSLKDIGRAHGWANRNEGNGFESKQDDLGW